MRDDDIIKLWELVGQYINLFQYSIAIKLLRRIYKETKDIETLLYSAYCYYQLGDEEKSLEIMVKYYNLGGIY